MARGTMAWLWAVCPCVRLLARTKFVFSRFLAFGLCMNLFEPWLRWDKQDSRLSSAHHSCSSSPPLTQSR